MDSMNKRIQLFRGRESGQRRGFTKETEGGEKKETQCAELHLCCVLSCCESLLMLLLHHDSGLLLPMNAEGLNSVLYSLIRLGRVMGYMVRRYVIRSQKNCTLFKLQKKRHNQITDSFW